MATFRPFLSWSLVFAGAWLEFSALTQAADLGEGTVTALLPTVQKMNGGNSEIVSVGDKISAGGQIQTQAQAVAEITFPDGSKIRIGNNSTFSFDPNDRTVRLDRGSALVCTPPAAEGINIVSGGVSGTMAGDPAGKTFLVTAYPADGSGGKTAGATGGFGLVVLQGNAATTVAAPSGSVTIAPGQLAVIGASGGAPSLHTVDLAQVIRSTPLIGGFPTPLPTTGAILNTAIGQQTQISRGVLTPTGTSGVAITFGGQLLTAGSPPPNSAPPSFTMAVSSPGFNGNLTGTATVSQLANINTAGGGGGSGPFGGLTPSGVTGGGGGGPGGPSAPGSINTPNNTGQQGVSANPTPLSAVASVTTKVYDGTTDADLTGASLTGSATSASLANDTTGTFASKNAGSGITVTTGMILIGAGASLYSFTAPTLTGTITAKDITMTGSTVNKVYDGNTTATVSLGTLSGLVGSEQLQVSLVGGPAAGTFGSKDVGGSQAVSVTYQLADDLVTGGLVSNYNLTNPTENLTGTITAKDLQVFSATVTTKVYDGGTGAVVTGAVLMGNSTGPTDGKFIGSEVVTLGNAGAGTFVDKNVGTGKAIATAMTLGGADAGNYTLSQPNLTGTITAKGVTISSGSAAGKVYDGNTTAAVTASVTITGLVAGEALGTTTATGTFASKDVGTRNVSASYTLTDGANLASNYNLLNPTETLSATITAKDLQVFSGVVTTKVYDGTDSAVVTGAVLVGNSTADNDGKFIGSETVTLSGGTSGTFADKNVGSGKTVSTAMTLGGADASNYTLLNQPALTGDITAKDVTIGSGSAAGKVYDGNTTAAVTASVTITGLVAGETLGTTTATGTFTSKDVGTRNVAASYTLTDGANPLHLAGNYNLLNPTETLSAAITAKDVTIGSGSAAGKVYDGNTTAAVTASVTITGLVAGEALGTTTAAGTFAGKDVGTRNVAASYTLTDGANPLHLAGNYNLLNPTETLSAAITAKDVTIGSGSAAGKVYDGNTTAAVTASVTITGLVAGEALGTTTAAGTFASKDVGTRNVSASYTLTDGANPLHLAGNYNLLNPTETLSATITQKDLVVSGAGITVNKAYDGSTAINGFTDVTIGASALTGSSTGANDGKYIGTENVTLAVDAAGTFERRLPGTEIPISTTVKLASGNAVNDNYTLRGQPTGLKGEITGSATLDQNGAALNVSTGSRLHVRNTTATRMQNGMTFQTSAGEVLIENSSFDGWMQRSSTATKVDDGGAVTFQFTESAAVAVNSPVLRIKMEANDPNAAPGAGGANLDYMLLGDYQMQLRHDPDGTPANGDELTKTIFSLPGSADDPSGIGSIAPAADLVVRDTASTEFKDLDWNTAEYTSLDGSGNAVASGNYATASGEYKPDSPAAMSDFNTLTAAGDWEVDVADPALGGEGKVTDLRLKYNNNTKVLIEGPDGIRLLNVKFEGMDEVDVRTTDLNNRVLMSATLLNDPDVTKMVVKASQTLEAVLNSDATFQEVKSLQNADLLAGVVRDNSSPTGFKFVAGADRTLTIDGPGAASVTPNINIAGQLAIAAHTVVFNNANIASDGVIGVRTRDGLVNRTYGSVVPGTTSFTGANGNYFLNRNNGNPISMTIGSNADITGAFTGGKLTDFGSGGTGTVMSVGRVQ